MRGSRRRAIEQLFFTYARRPKKERHSDGTVFNDFRRLKRQLMKAARKGHSAEYWRLTRLAVRGQ